MRIKKKLKYKNIIDRNITKSCHMLMPLALILSKIL